MNRALAHANQRGFRAALAGDAVTACPYEDLRTGRGAVTYSRAFVNEWHRGWKLGAAKRAEIEATKALAAAPAAGA